MTGDDITGADIAGALMRADAPLLAVVAPESMKAGVLPENVALPALLVRIVSSGDRQPLKRPGVVRVTDRVSVSVRARSYREQVAVIGLLRRCLAGKTGNIGGAERVSILTAGKGPDLIGPGNTFEQSQDFRVSFDDAE